MAIFFSDQLIGKEKKSITKWREDFDYTSKRDKLRLLKKWRLTGKPGTPLATFSIEKDKQENLSFLRFEATRASGSLICRADGENLKNLPILKWRWRAITLPKEADGRVSAKDDQAIGIYIGTGNMWKRKSISYRWDTETPKGSKGECTYGLGTTKVKWHTLRNKLDNKENEWYIEERNYVEDFKEAWGFYPKKLYLGISCNSQYTNTKAAADLDWIEFMPAR